MDEALKPLARRVPMTEELRPLARRVAMNVKRLRDARGWSQVHLAERSDLNERQIGQIERAEVNVTMDTLRKVAIGLSVDVSELFAREADRHVTLSLPVIDLVATPVSDTASLAPTLAEIERALEAARESARVLANLIRSGRIRRDDESEDPTGH